ncbi:hypothetical protein ABID77_004476, partial [Variovorax sp. PvP013]
TPKMFFFSASTASVNFRQTKRRVSEAFDYDTRVSTLTSISKKFFHRTVFA